ncbi:hypothetical protein ABFS82_08G172600 [Erythranthe guttata]|uniref:Extracellular ligand-gated ion channel n=1 Tax=Erythranthe guttata TaxID=4155 RepID=A0A022R0A7_ERYGU|nr:PREDICTED: uncharacterized protein LOC105962050 [Erythranthe guttata]EYU33671.1 hypothetical protein MIMGU_mgv1a024798mg [Erythranthe guttata]|eukprot:XP_012841775.1 PREDICTED: uncharacterized protein LOC105962050 [Erythranthe guttata]
MGDARVALLNHENNNRRAFSRSQSHAHDELRGFRRWLKCLCVDQSDRRTACLSWLVFFVLTVVVPAVSHFVFACGGRGDDCDSLHSRPYDAVAQLSLSGIAALSFICLSEFVRKFGLRRFLFFDKLCDESETVRKGYTKQFNRSMKLLFIFVLPCFAAEGAYKIWWYTSGGTRIPFLGNTVISNTVACALELCSWFYRTVVFFLVCILFRLICCLQILRLQDFAQVFVQVDSNVESVLKEHLRIRRHLRIISHRYRLFILWALVFITASQFASLFVTTRNADVNIYHTGELAVCSVSLLAGLLILLRSATKITHKAQSVTCLAAKWHVCATIDSFDHTADQAHATPVGCVADEHLFTLTSDGPSDQDDVGDEEDELDNTQFVPSYAYSTISFQKRQALVNYFENNRAGITIFGFMLDRSSLHTIFGIELSLVLWLLGKTIGIS